MRLQHSEQPSVKNYGGRGYCSYHTVIIEIFPLLEETVDTLRLLKLIRLPMCQEWDVWRASDEIMTMCGFILCESVVEFLAIDTSTPWRTVPNLGVLYYYYYYYYYYCYCYYYYYYYSHPF